MVASNVRVADWKAVRQNLNSNPEVSNSKPGILSFYNPEDDHSNE
jgi:hypothetical protein